MMLPLRPFLRAALLVGLVPLACLVSTAGAPLASAQTIGKQAVPAGEVQGPPAPAAAVPLSQTEEQLSAEVEGLAAKLAAVEKAIDVPHPTAALLGELANDMPPLAARAQGIVDRLTPRTVATKARLDQLGPKGASDSADLLKERAALQKSFDDNDGLLKRAKVLEVKAQQDASFIAKRQHALFTTSLFQRSTSILSPQLWLQVMREAPGDVADATRVFESWLDGFNGDLTGGKLLAFWALVAAVVLLYWPLTGIAKHLIARRSQAAEPSDWQRILVAVWTSLSVGASAIAITAAVTYVFSFVAVADGRIAPLFTAIQVGVVRIAVAAGLARGILAPDRPRWRLVDLDETTVDKLTRIVVGIAVVVSVIKVIESLNEVIYASETVSIAVRGIGAALVAMAMAVALAIFGDDPEASDPAVATSSPAQRQEWFGLLRGLAWGLILLIVAAVLAGYSPFAGFLVDQLVLVAGVGAALFLVVSFVDQACAVVFDPKSMIGRNLLYTVGLRRESLEQLSILLSGGVRLILIVVAMLVVAAPWGMQSTDVAGNLHAAFFGFRVGDFTISIAGIAVAVILFGAVLAATRAIQNWLEDRYLPHTRLDAGLRNSIKTSLGYVGFLLALGLAAANVGVDFQKLAIVAGALSVGIGFGLQSIVNNFVSGLILLWERAVRVGDWVVVGADQGYVRKINVRSTEIETFDRAAVIVPNSNLVSGVVKNLMRTDRVGRLTIELSVHASADPEKVREVLIELARDNEAVLSLPSPQVRFTNLTASAMTFDLFCFVADVEAMTRTKSDLYFAICAAFRRHGFFDGPAADPTAINILGLDRLESLLEAGRDRRIDDGADRGVETARPRKTG